VLTWKTRIPSLSSFERSRYPLPIHHQHLRPFNTRKHQTFLLSPQTSSPIHLTTPQIPSAHPLCQHKRTYPSAAPTTKSPTPVPHSSYRHSCKHSPISRHAMSTSHTTNHVLRPPNCLPRSSSTKLFALRWEVRGILRIGILWGGGRIVDCMYSLEDCFRVLGYSCSKLKDAVYLTSVFLSH
jgi:hypothetical protein